MSTEPTATPTTTCPHCQATWRIGGKAAHEATCPLLQPKIILSHQHALIDPRGGCNRQDAAALEVIEQQTKWWQECAQQYKDTVSVELESTEPTTMRHFPTGATRSSNIDKPAYASYLSPLVLERFGAYMLHHEVQEDGQRREPGNWKKGMPQHEYLESALRHVLDWWLLHEGSTARTVDVEEALCGVLFNCMGYLHGHLKETHT